MRTIPLSLLHVEERMPQRVVDILVENFEIDDDVMVPAAHRMDFSDWMELVTLHRPGLKYPNFAPRVIWGPNDADEVFEAEREDPPRDGIDERRMIPVPVARAQHELGERDVRNLNVRMGADRRVRCQAHPSALSILQPCCSPTPRSGSTGCRYVAARR